MQIQNVGAQNFRANNSVQRKRTNASQQVAFKASFVTLAKKNSGEFLRDEIIKPFNKGIFKQMAEATKKEAQQIIDKVSQTMPGKIQKAEDLNTEVNYFTLAAGKGSRFLKLAEASGNELNKVAVKFHVDEKESVSMLDLPLAASKHFAGPEGHKTILADEKSGSLGDVIKHYLAGNEIKDTIIRCGDNVFGDKSKVMTEFMVETINNPNKHLGLIGVERQPEEVVKKFATFKVESQKGRSDVMSLLDSKEKPATVEIAKKYSTEKGTNVAQTGMIYYSKEAMTKLVNEIKDSLKPGSKVKNPIKKDDVEIYDFAYAVEHIHKNMKKMLGIEPSKGADVKVIKEWEDVGEPDAYYKMMQGMGESKKFLQNFPENFANKVQKAIQNKTNFDGDNKFILFSKKVANAKDVSKKAFDNATDIEGVKIINDATPGM